MDEQTVRKTYQYKLNPTPEQERELGRMLGLCRWLYHTALEHRIIAWQRARVSVSRFQQEAELKDIRAAFPECAAIHWHVLQDVLARLDKTYQAFFRRVQRGAKAGFPRLQGRDRWHSFTFKEVGNGATLDHGFLVLSKIGRMAVRWSRLIEGTPKTVTISREADGWYVCFSCADAPVQPLLPTTGQEAGIDLGIEAFATISQGTRIFSPGWYRKADRALKTAQRRVSRRKKGSHRRRKAITLLAKAHQTVKRQRHDFPPRLPATTSRHDFPPRLPSQDGARAATRERDRRSRGLAGPQHGHEPPPRKIHSGRGLGGVLEHLHLQVGMRW
jgi:putative transposase